MYIVNKRLSIGEFAEYLNQYRMGMFRPNKLVIHHTWRPTKKDWNGQHSIEGLKKYYERKGWRAGPHIFIAEDGIWLFSPMNRVGIHAGLGNLRSIGIEVVGDYDTQKWSGATKANALGVITLLMKKLGLTTEVVKFHRDFSRKSCPGHAITKEWLFRQLNYYQNKDEIPNWLNVAGKMSAKDVWEKARSKKYLSKSSKFNDPLTIGKLFIFLARLFPNLFK